MYDICTNDLSFAKSFKFRFDLYEIKLKVSLFNLSIAYIFYFNENS